MQCVDLLAGDNIAFLRDEDAIGWWKGTQTPKYFFCFAPHEQQAFFKVIVEPDRIAVVPRGHIRHGKATGGLCKKFHLPANQLGESILLIGKPYIVLAVLQNGVDLSRRKPILAGECLLIALPVYSHYLFPAYQPEVTGLVEI